MKDIKVVLENLSDQEIKLDDAQALFLKAFIEQDSLTNPQHFFRKIILVLIYIFGVQWAGAKQCCYRRFKIHIF